MRLGYALAMTALIFILIGASVTGFVLGALNPMPWYDHAAVYVVATALGGVGMAAVVLA